jgi:hypothetical protein
VCGDNIPDKILHEVPQSIVAIAQSGSNREVSL